MLVSGSVPRTVSNNKRKESPAVKRRTRGDIQPLEVIWRKATGDLVDKSIGSLSGDYMRIIMMGAEKNGMHGMKMRVQLFEDYCSRHYEFLKNNYYHESLVGRGFIGSIRISYLFTINGAYGIYGGSCEGHHKEDGPSHNQRVDHLIMRNTKMKVSSTVKGRTRGGNFEKIYWRLNLNIP